MFEIQSSESFKIKAIPGTCLKSSHPKISKAIPGTRLNSSHPKVSKAIPLTCLKSSHPKISKATPGTCLKPSHSTWANHKGAHRSGSKTTRVVKLSWGSLSVCEALAGALRCSNNHESIHASCPLPPIKNIALPSSESSKTTSFRRGRLAESCWLASLAAILPLSALTKCLVHAFTMCLVQQALVNVCPQ